MFRTQVRGKNSSTQKIENVQRKAHVKNEEKLAIVVNNFEDMLKKAQEAEEKLENKIDAAQKKLVYALNRVKKEYINNNPDHPISNASKKLDEMINIFNNPHTLNQDLKKQFIELTKEATKEIETFSSKEEKDDREAILLALYIVYLKAHLLLSNETRLINNRLIDEDLIVSFESTWLSAIHELMATIGTAYFKLAEDTIHLQKSGMDTDIKNGFFIAEDFRKLPSKICKHLPTETMDLTESMLVIAKLKSIAIKAAIFELKVPFSACDAQKINTQHSQFVELLKNDIESVKGAKKTHGSFGKMSINENNKKRILAIFKLFDEFEKNANDFFGRSKKFQTEFTNYANLLSSQIERINVNKAIDIAYAKIIDALKGVSYKVYANFNNNKEKTNKQKELFAKKWMLASTSYIYSTVLNKDFEGISSELHEFYSLIKPILSKNSDKRGSEFMSVVIICLHKLNINYDWEYMSSFKKNIDDDTSKNIQQARYVLYLKAALHYYATNKKIDNGAINRKSHVSYFFKTLGLILMENNLMTSEVKKVISEQILQFLQLLSQAEELEHYRDSIETVAYKKLKQQYGNYLGITEKWLELKNKLASIAKKQEEENKLCSEKLTQENSSELQKEKDKKDELIKGKWLRDKLATPIEPHNFLDLSAQKKEIKQVEIIQYPSIFRAISNYEGKLAKHAEKKARTELKKIENLILTELKNLTGTVADEISQYLDMPLAKSSPEICFRVILLNYFYTSSLLKCHQENSQIASKKDCKKAYNSLFTMNSSLRHIAESCPSLKEHNTDVLSDQINELLTNHENLVLDNTDNYNESLVVNKKISNISKYGNETATKKKLIDLGRIIFWKGTDAVDCIFIENGEKKRWSHVIAPQSPQIDALDLAYPSPLFKK